MGSAAKPLDNSQVHHQFQFSGKAGEFFRIWIVNVLLTILTLGIYSAWAKVRTNRYFYSSTTLAGSSFSYLAKPGRNFKRAAHWSGSVNRIFHSESEQPNSRFWIVAVNLAGNARDYCEKSRL